MVLSEDVDLGGLRDLFSWIERAYDVLPELGDSGLVSFAGAQGNEAAILRSSKDLDGGAEELRKTYALSKHSDEVGGLGAQLGRKGGGSPQAT